MTRKTVFALAAALLLFPVLVHVCDAVLPGSLFIEAVVELDHRDRLQVFYSGGGDFSERHSFFSEMIEPGRPQTVRIRLHHAPMRKFRLDLGEHAGSVQLHKLTIAALFAEDAVLGPADMHRLLDGRDSRTPMRWAADFVEMQTSSDSWLVCNESLLHPHRLPLYSIPLLFSLLLFLVLHAADFRNVAALTDLRSKRPSNGEQINALDGLRALAVLMVVADHTWGAFSGLGASGVWIFMTLSGFLLARPFIQQPERAASLTSWRQFFLRRIRRILPLYYAYIVAVFLLHARFEPAILHFLFLKGNGHLWVVPQEMVFYLLTPPVMLLSCLLLQGRPLLVIPALTGLMLLVNRFLDTRVIALHGMNDTPLRLYFGVFLAGIIASWLYHSLWQHVRPELHTKVEPWAAALAVCILLFLILCSEEHLWGGERIFAQIYFQWFGAAAALLILAVLAAGSRLRLLGALPLRSLSLVSFSVYLVHPLILELIRQAAAQYWGKTVSGLPLFLATLVLSYLFACITYSLIERPFLRSAA
jgi:peptidoglycan/LPS O-acetylase OafA/YrhL